MRQKLEPIGNINDLPKDLTMEKFIEIRKLAFSKMKEDLARELDDYLRKNGDR